ncbi:hypothetical protein E2493_15905 [Sphingomonas parva]|uniref:Uncharacterized protein n=1 Tax=Sphingomonas parva TaxID=2555898 RepID=A0A4Y8ZS17_9SPHN|nr:hypothetical protein [Sphingomonas parva]TFI57196.1 hypothetical protein E2493_15905 [Sphingomonas parva]
MARHDYTLFGLRIRSELLLPELPPDAGDARPDVAVRIGPVSEEGPESGYAPTAAGLLLSAPGIGRYLIVDGREIVIDPAPGASERNLRLYLLGSAFGALLHQRGMMPLHANAIAVDGRAIAFCGHSGAGKSTLAAWFNDRGHEVLADDVCVIGFDGGGTPVAKPGLRRLRLWIDALAATGRTASDYERSFDGLRDVREKYDVPIARPEHVAEIPLGAIYLLDRAPEGSTEGRIVPLSGVDRIDAIVANTYRGGLLPTLGGTAEHLATCLRIAARVPVFRAERLWGHESLDIEASRMAAHARSILDP